MSDIKIHYFQNGFKLIYQKSSHTIPLSTIHIIVNVGSAYEVNGIRGASHLVEHMCFKGTHSIPNAQSMMKQYNKIGAYMNAYTEKRYTGYVIDCDDSHLDMCINNISNMLLESVFSKTEFTKEQRVVIEENIRIKDDNSYSLAKELDKIYYKGSTYENSIDHIKYHPTNTTLDYHDVFNWYKSFYHPSNMICSIISNKPLSHIISILSSTGFTKKIPKHPLQKGLSYPILTLTPKKHYNIVYQSKKGISATILHVGFRTCNFYSNDKYILKIIQHIFNGFSGKLFTIFRTKHGLTYHSSCNVEYHEHTGYISIDIQTDPKKLFENKNNPSIENGVLPLLFQLISYMIDKGVTTSDIMNAKGNIKGRYLRNMDNIKNINEYNAIQMTMNVKDIIPYEDIYEKCIANITKSQINKTIKKYFCKENMIIGLMYGNPISKHKIDLIIDKWMI